MKESMRKRIPSFLMAILLIINICSSITAVQAASSRTTLPVPIYQQEKTNWCWAAAARMAGVYKYWTTSVTQSEIVGFIKGSSNINEPGDIFETAESITYVTKGLYSALTAGQWPMSNIEHSIDNDYPVVPLVNDGNTGHYYVICGYNSSKIVLNDPWTGTQKTCNWSDFAKGNTSSGWSDNRPYVYTVHFKDCF